MSTGTESDDIRKSLITIAQAQLPATFKQMIIVSDVEENARNRAQDRFNIDIGDSDEDILGRTRAHNINQTYTLTLTRYFKYTKGVGDADSSVIKAQLRDLTLDVYDEIIKQKGGVASDIIVIIKEATTTSIVFKTDENIIESTKSFVIQYRREF